MIEVHKNNTINLLKKDGPPIIVVTAVQESEAIINSCTSKGITVSGVCDSFKEKTYNPFSGVKVFHTPELPKHFTEARFIIASQHVQECVDQLIGLGYKDFFSPLDLIEDYNVNNHKHSISAEYMKNKLEVCKKSHELYFDKSKTYMRSLDVMITTRCSLKCNNCSNLMQYYKNPEHTDGNEIVKALDIIHENVDHISEYRVIGGEPLMNKDWANIVNSLSIKNPNPKIFIYTNGTIAPKEEQIESFQGKNINFIITDYGKLSKNVEKMVSILKKFNIGFTRDPAEYWIDCSNIKHHKRSTADLVEVFKQCCVKYIYTLLNGRLYRCPFIANATNLKAMPDNPANYVDVFNNKNNLKNDIKRLIKVAKFFPGCDFCDGRPYDPSNSLGYDGRGMIAPGEQVSKPIDYKVYEK